MDSLSQAELPIDDQWLIEALRPYLAIPRCRAD